MNGQDVKPSVTERIAEQIAGATHEEQIAIESMLWGYFAGRKREA